MACLKPPIDPSPENWSFVRDTIGYSVNHRREAPCSLRSADSEGSPTEITKLKPASVTLDGNRAMTVKQAIFTLAPAGTDEEARLRRAGGRQKAVRERGRKAPNLGRISDRSQTAEGRPESQITRHNLLLTAAAFNCKKWMNAVAERLSIALFALCVTTAWGKESRHKTAL